MISEPPIGAQASELTRDLTLNSPSEPEAKLPKLIYGTAWKTERTADLVYKALKNGFRAIDTAAQPQHYDEEGAGTGIRRAIGEGIIAREDLFVSTPSLETEPLRDLANSFRK
jgi:diketogulonate reductase-like aldo/keto reductase